MRPFVPDVSVAAAWCFEDESTPFTDRLFRSAQAGTPLLVPILWRHELVNVLVQAVRRGRVTVEHVEAFLATGATLRVVPDLGSWHNATTETKSLSLTHSLTAYDAAYLELALRRACPLATFDTALARAARALGVSLLEP